MMRDPDLERVTISLDPGRLPKWTKGADCKSAGTGLRWFESNTVHFWQPRLPVGSAALIAQSVERVLGKNEVMGSNPIEGFLPNKIEENEGNGILVKEKRSYGQGKI